MAKINGHVATGSWPRHMATQLRGHTAQLCNLATQLRGHDETMTVATPPQLPKERS